MKFKKVIGCLVLALTAVFVNTGQASLAFVGVEDMPKSMKENNECRVSINLWQGNPSCRTFYGFWRRSVYH